MTSVTLPGSGGTVTFAYDPFGRRIKKVTSTTTSIYAYDGDNLVEETNSSGAVVARYSQTQNIDEPLAMLRSGTTSYFHADGLGSVTSLSSAAGSIVNTYTYDSFGKLTASTGSLVNPFQYTARESDSETGLYYYRARYYDPAVGRFVGEDPIAFNGGNNFYAFVENDPSNLNDPFGLCAPSAPMKECLEKIFNQPIDGVQFQMKPKPDSTWAATTRRNKIILYIPCDTFFSSNGLVIEEYFHVLRQWNTGSMNMLSYGLHDLRGHDKNKFEKQADEFAKKHLPELGTCLKCKILSNSLYLPSFSF
jgi:RHS repeat-associated protein